LEFKGPGLKWVGIQGSWFKVELKSKGPGIKWVGIQGSWYNWCWNQRAWLKWAKALVKDGLETKGLVKDGLETKGSG